MNRTQAIFNPQLYEHSAKIDPEHKDLIFTIIIENYNPKDNFEDLLVSVWTIDTAKNPYEFNYVDMVRDARQPWKVNFIIPFDHFKDLPPYSVRLYSDENTIDVSN